MDSSYNFVMSEVDCSTSNYLVILQCSYFSFTGSCEQNREEVSVVCCESFSSYFMCVCYSCMHGHENEKYLYPLMHFYSIYQNMEQPLAKPDSFVPGSIHKSGSSGGVL